MKKKRLFVIVFALGMTLSACSPFIVAQSAGAQPAPAAGHDAVQPGYQAVPIEHVMVETGTGSPIPVHIVASGTWPDLCAQIAEIRSEVKDFQVEVTILASTAESCPPDRLGLPFRIDLPLNIVEMESGSYHVMVNGTAAAFELPPAQ